MVGACCYVSAHSVLQGKSLKNIQDFYFQLIGQKASMAGMVTFMPLRK